MSTIPSHVPGPFPSIPPPFFSSSSSRRVRSRFNRANNINNKCNNILNGLNFLHSSFAPNFDRVSKFNIPSASVSNIHSHITHSVCRSLDCCSCHKCGQQVLTHNDSFHNSDWGSINSYYSSTTTPLNADTVSLPSEAGSASLCNILPPHLSFLYSDPEHFLLPPDITHPAGVTPIRDHNEYAKLIRRMYDAGMVTFDHKPKCINSLFTVDKDGKSERLIIDARRANSMFRPPPSVFLPSPDVLSHLVIDESSQLFIGTDDLDNFYHRIKLPTKWVPYFGLPRVKASNVGLSDLFGDIYLHPCCLTLPMGFSHSVFLAQSAHEHLIYTYTPLLWEDRISKDNDFNVNRIRHSVYIDDITFFGYDPHELSLIQQRYASVMTHFGLPIKQSKHQAPTSGSVRVLGLEVNGTLGTIGLARCDMRSLVHTTLSIIRHGFVSGHELSRIVGKWTWAILPIRPMLSIFSAVYKYIEKVNYRRGVLWPSVIRELELLTILAPLAWSSLKVPWCSHVIATDASSVGMGVVSQPIDPITSADINTTCGNVSPDSPPSSSLSSVLSSPWSPVISYPWNNPNEHINILEFRAVLSGLRWSLSLPHSSFSRLILLTDSAVVSHIINKGRSSSPALLSRSRTLASILIASAFQLRVHWISTSVNPADVFSRNFNFMVN